MPAERRKLGDCSLHRYNAKHRRGISIRIRCSYLAAATALRWHRGSGGTTWKRNYYGNQLNEDEHVCLYRWQWLLLLLLACVTSLSSVTPWCFVVLSSTFPTPNGRGTGRLPYIYRVLIYIWWKVSFFFLLLWGESILKLKINVKVGWIYRNIGACFTYRVITNWSSRWLDGDRALEMDEDGDVL